MVARCLGPGSPRHPRPPPRQGAGRGARQFTPVHRNIIVCGMDTARSVPQFHLYGEAANEQAFDFIHAETIRSRSTPLNWVIEPHSHRYLHQLTYVAEGGGVLTIETDEIEFGDATLIVLAPTVAHSFHFHPDTRGVVLSFTEDVIRGSADTRGSLSGRLAGLERLAVVPLAETLNARVSDLARRILQELEDGRDGAQIAMRAYLALMIIAAAREMPEGARPHAPKVSPLDETVNRLRQLVEDNFRQTRNLSAYAEWMAMTPDRLNEHCKKAAGVTAGHLIRQRLLVEAKRQLIFTAHSVSEIAYGLNFSDPSYFSRFFRKYAGVTPQQFRQDHR